MSRRVRDQIYAHVFENDTHEVGGVLVGHLAGDQPIITGAIAALEARGERASVTFTHDAWALVHEELDRRFEGQTIVGWYHSHPGFGIFLSGHDMFIHENFFSQPGQVAYVVDPHAGTEGMFGWVDGEVTSYGERQTARPGTGGVRSGSRQWDGAPSRSSARDRYPLLGYALPLLVGLVVGVVLAAQLVGGSPTQQAAPRTAAGATSTAQPTATPPRRERRQTPARVAPADPTPTARKPCLPPAGAAVSCTTQ